MLTRADIVIPQHRGMILSFLWLQLSPAVFPSTAQGAVPGPSTLPLFDQPDGEESWKEVAQGLMDKVRACDLFLTTHYVWFWWDEGQSTRESNIKWVEM